ncbi:ORC1-type DNA replication protein [Methanoculleus sp. FWC-SCC1]|uniref:ORC1-type DNA replication protein n=1 Tax=Methanoculleus frigidifontis TaxID=2584085 RepID=A0ABT8M6N5_9EURY|nr:ORC1-type DNA replication protein [Methanoculleus sp. FWC-SCC1]MDN7023590.1 ORC1-type DNA replication protein [Methanoculleus sp. FWC-SCC1]
MAKQFLLSDQTLFRDVDVFEIDYVPEFFNYREPQMSELAYQISPALRGGRALNAICTGLPGTGKTTSVLRVFTELEQFRGKVLPVYVNCQTDRTKYMVYSRVYATLFGHTPPRTGLSILSVMDAIGDSLQKRKLSLVVCLDDANLLHYDGVLGDVLNSLLRLHQDYPGVRTGVFATISDIDLDLVTDLDPWVVSVFRPTMIYFPPYDADEIRGILRERVRAGLYPKVLSPEMFDIIVEQTMESGDVRVGLDLVKRAAMHAERAARTEVVREDIMAAYEQARHVHLVCTVRALSAGERLLFRQIAELSQEQTEPLISKNIYAAVKDTAKIGYTVFFKRLQKLNSLRLVDMIRVRSSDRTNEIVLRYEPEKVREVCG